MTQRAVLVGCNYYNTSNQLAGCVNDVHRVADVLRSVYKFPNENITFLCDNVAPSAATYPTKANIQKALAALRAATQAGDVAVFHYSGHGTTVRNCGSTNTVYACTDDAIIPVDVLSGNSYRPENEIVDDELWAWSSSFPDGSFLFSIIDACHSGSALDLPYALSINPGSTGTYSLKKVERRPDTSAKVVMLSGCKDDQTSLDSRDNLNQPAGALTYSLCDYILHHPSASISYFDFLQQIRAQIKANNKLVSDIQEPQLCFGRVADSNTLFTLLPPSRARAVSFDDALLKSLLETLKNPPPTTPPPAPVQPKATAAPTAPAPFVPPPAALPKANYPRRNPSQTMQQVLRRR